MDELPDASLVEALRSAAAQLDLTLEEAMVEKAEELRHRAFFRLIPDSRLSDRQVPAFVHLVTGRAPSDDLVERVSVVRRGVRISSDEIMVLEARQNFRCAVCGVILHRVVGPSVDHITPLALGGKNETWNYQLLCRNCNSGKGKLPAWMVGVPYLTTRLSSRLRYCVLARYGSRCQSAGCIATARNSNLEVKPRIPGSHGGRLIFDNLFVLCESHARRREQSARRRALEQLRLSPRRRRVVNLAKASRIGRGVRREVD
jgi:5-methylcytosine-specific restriction endonuclease McrA